MPEMRWEGTTPDGRKAEYCYHQSDAGCWATRKAGDIADSRSPAPRGLTRDQVEALFSEN